MQTQSDQDDTREAILVEIIGVENRLKFLSKVEISNGEEIKREELSAIFAAFSNDLKNIRKNYQSTM